MAQSLQELDDKFEQHKTRICQVVSGQSESIREILQALEASNIQQVMYKENFEF